MKVGQVSEIPTNKTKMVKIKEKEILLANIEGKTYAISNKCSHAGGNLSKGTLIGTIITCPRHGSKFDITTGKSISGPKILFIRMKTKDLVKYETKIENNDIFVRES